MVEVRPKLHVGLDQSDLRLVPKAARVSDRQIGRVVDDLAVLVTDGRQVEAAGGVARRFPAPTVDPPCVAVVVESRSTSRAAPAEIGPSSRPSKRTTPSGRKWPVCTHVYAGSAPKGRGRRPTSPNAQIATWPPKSWLTDGPWMLDARSVTSRRIWITTRCSSSFRFRGTQRKTASMTSSPVPISDTMMGGGRSTTNEPPITVGYSGAAGSRTSSPSHMCAMLSMLMRPNNARTLSPSESRTRIVWFRRVNGLQRGRRS